MHKMDDKEMDALFQEGAEHQEFSYQASSWEMMEEKLDKRDRKILFFRVFGVIGILLLIGGGLYFSPMNGRYTEASLTDGNIKNSSINKNTSTLKIPDLENEVVRKLSNENDRRSDQQSNEYDDMLSEVSTKEKIVSNIESKIKSTSQVTQKRTRTNTTTSAIAASIEESSYWKSSSLEIVANESTIIANRTTSKKQETEQSVKMSRINKDIKLARLASLVSGVKSQEEPILDVFGAFANISMSTATVPLGYSVSVFANPEWSSVGLFSESRMGWKVGAKFGIDFTDKFQGGIGFAISQKRYGGTGAEYIPADGWVDDIVPMWMDAKCTVIEIPIEASFYFNGHDNNGFFINAGISSYMLNSQWYGFKYDEMNISTAQLNKVVKEITPEEVEPRHHVVGVGKISFGYHYRLSAGTAFEISPYLQIPMTGIGEGSVDLYSSGVQLAFRFNN